MTENEPEESFESTEGQTQAYNLIDIALVQDYLKILCPVLLDSKPELFVKFLNAPNTLKILEKFISDTKSPVLFVQKRIDQLPSSEDSEDPNTIFSMGLDVEFTEERSIWIAFIKKQPNFVIDVSRSVASQLQVIELGEGSPLETLHTLLHNSISPYVRSYVKSRSQKIEGTKERAPKAGGIGLVTVTQKVAELELALYNCKQNVEIPTVTLTYHPEIKAASKRCQEMNKPLTPDELGEKVRNPQFLNALQAGVNTWIKEIYKVTKLERIEKMPPNTETIQEIRFWLELENELLNIERQLKQPEAECTLNTLKQAKRFYATAAFDTDTIGLKKAMEKVLNYKPLMKDFPINDLLASSEISQLSDALKNIFEHLKKTKNAHYPIQRYLRLIEAISRDLCNKVLDILHAKQIMNLPYSEFDKITNECRALFTLWDDQFSKFREIIRELARKRRQEDIPLRVNVETKNLQERILSIRAFRKQHEELREVIERVLSPGEGSQQLLSDMKSSYDQVKAIDPLILSKEGNEIWIKAMKVYDEKIDRVETHIKEHLRDRLATAKNANEMFRVFSKFNALFVRPKIKAAIQEYQAQLIEHVKEDIRKLHERFKNRYPNSQAALMSTLRDLPPISGAIIWARQIERQLKTYMRRVEDVLGKHWEVDVQGQQLKADFDHFKKKLNTDSIFEEWLRETERRNFEVTGRILNIVKKGNTFILDINFDPQIVTLFKEVRNLQWLGYRVPFTITMLSSGGRQVYPFAVSLKEIIRTYTQTCSKITPEMSLLVAAYKREAQKYIDEGFKLKWEVLAKLDSYVSQFSHAVQVFQEKVDDVKAKYTIIKENLDSLVTCPFREEILRKHLNNIQKVVDDLNLANYSNLHVWSKNLDQMIESILLEKLKLAITGWIELFEDHSSKTQPPTEKMKKLSESQTLVIRRKGSSREPDVTTPRKSDKRDPFLHYIPKIRTTIHEIIIRNQLMQLDPPLDYARANLISRLNDWLAVVTGLPRIVSTRYDESLVQRSVDDHERTYRELLKKLPHGTLETAYQTIEKKLKEVNDYVQIWFQYQSLWDMEPATVYARLGNDLSAWQRLLHEIKRSRTTFDTAASQKDFGPIIIRYGQVQANVNNKYDYWHKDILYNFGTRLGEAMKNFHGVISSTRVELESKTIEAVSTMEAVALILRLQEVRKNLKGWEAEIGNFKNGQELLTRQRFQFPSDWLEYDMVEGEWNAFNELLNRKIQEVNNEIPSLQKKILEESKGVEEKVKQLQSDWASGKPLEGNVEFKTALDTLKIFERRVSTLEEETNRISKAKLALDLDDNSKETIKPILNAIGQEILDLKSVWTELSESWKAVDELKETLWSAVVPRKVRRALEDIIARLKQLPNRIRQYQAFHHVQKQIKGYLKVNGIITELRSEALKDRHWKALKKRLNTNWIFSELTLGNLWDSDIQKNEAIYKEIITQAQGELALEEFLKQIREYWQAYELDLVMYQKKCYLIRGWDELFAKLSENLNSLSAMKNSPYYKVFEEEANNWEEKLNRLQALFDTWINVQRRWVYLESIFSGSSDIRNLLPQDSSRFESINIEFLNLMKQVVKNRHILEVLNIEGVERKLERLADLLTKIQKALGDYLEKQRAAFPRFKLQKHLKKMFAGINSMILDETQTVIKGMASPEGEIVPFRNQIAIKDFSSIDGWLKAFESEMKNTLASLLQQSLKELEDARNSLNEFEYTNFYLTWIDKYPSQLVVLGTQILWSQTVEKVLSKSDSEHNKNLNELLSHIDSTLSTLAGQILQDLSAIKRKKIEHLITELVHQRDVVRKLLKLGVTSATSFDWLSEMRFYWNPKEDNLLKKLTIQIANASFYYGYEYLGVGERLVQTPLTDRCYLTLTQALEWRLGGSPFGPAGTGKTETVKALGAQLGRFVLVFCCDEGFDFKAMNRIFVGLCQCGAWGCFDEFNRLEERILSAVSQQIQVIQVALKEKSPEVDLLDKKVQINPDMAIFVTMNPNYAGRSNLPDNLKQLFRSIAMIQPDRELIAQVMLYSQGFKTAERLASKIVPLFNLCQEQLSAQAHYDFGLRALKSVLVSAGNLMRHILKEQQQAAQSSPPAAGTEISQITSPSIPLKEHLPEIRSKISAEQRTSTNEFQSLSAAGVIGDGQQESDDAIYIKEQKVLLRSVCETVIPKLVAEDIPLFSHLLSDVFPGADVQQIQMEGLRYHIQQICKAHFLIPSPDWVEKLLQLYQIQALRHGVMLVGPSGSGKTTAWTVLLEALEKQTQIKSESYVLDPKAITKDQLFGSLDTTTREWTDGLFTHILRKIIDNARGESERRHWIVFDGDVDPEWVENLNALLDDNKLLTLPNGERLALPDNVRIIFEVQDLKYATLATVSRCGMIWFNEETVTNQMIFQNYLLKLKNEPLDEQERQTYNEALPPPPGLTIQRQIAEVLAPYFEPQNLVDRMLEYAASKEHIMDFTRLRVLTSMFALLNKGINNIITNASQLGNEENIQAYIVNHLIFSIMWGFGGSMALKEREAFSRHIQASVTIPTPDPNGPPLLDYSPKYSWKLWSTMVPKIEVEAHKVASPDVVVPTVDTVRHVEVLKAWLSERKPLILCGPPGSGKTMTLEDTLRSLPDLELVTLNFSSATTPALILKTFEHHCEYKRTPKGIVLRPNQMGKWLVIFCDEINLPAPDNYGTQRVITFIRQLTEQGGFWRSSDHTWIKLEKIQFVGACNPPTDPGRIPLTHRFLRHAPVLFVDFPSVESLHQIYGTFNRALLKMVPALSSYAQPLTAAMVEFYTESQKHFTPDMQSHYIYSPRELSRWVRALHEALQQWEDATLEDLVRLWMHEGLRLFQDRLVTAEEKKWTDQKIDSIALKHFPNVNPVALKRPILFSNWLSREYRPIEQEKLREYIKARLKVFYEEELDVPLVLFNEVLDHILRIDRVFRQPQGHALLIGVSGGGKTVLSRFVAWLNGLSIFTIKVNNRYKAADFEEDLRSVMKRAGVKEEKICFIFDESNALESSFLERMNTLLASGDVPGLFEGDEFTSLIHQIREVVHQKGLLIDSEAELYKWFVQQVRRNLHVVFTMNPANPDFHNRTATSPALFNRCVLDWFGEWSNEALFQVGQEFTSHMDLDVPSYKPPDFLPPLLTTLPISQPLTHRDALVSSMVYIHNTIHEANALLLKQQGRQNYVTPRHYLDFIHHFVKLVNEKRNELEEQQLHLTTGLQKLRDTENKVKELQTSLSKKNLELEAKNNEANAKLKRMIEDQQIAEEKRKELLIIQEKLDQQNKEIAAQKEIAYADLNKAEPALIEAQKAVKGIKKKDLEEIKALGKPPALVKMTLEAVCFLLKGKKEDWNGIRKVIVESGFISSIVNFDSKTITQKMRDVINADYLSQENFTFETVNRASQACGPLVKWLEAQVNYSSILDRVKPLRDRVVMLEQQAQEQAKKGEELNKTINELEKSIAKYKEDYAILISEAQEIKNEMAKVQNKVDRSIALLRNLSSERMRWELQSKMFQEQMATVLGDSLLCAAFLAYNGFFDQNYRASLLKKWKRHLEALNVSIKPDLSIINYLSHPDERLQWHANKLPNDDLCVENAIMLQRFNRYPLVIDPSGQATEFLMTQYKERKITKTSFLDTAFMKNLESALRFGTPLLVEDVENIDPVLNPVLNKEIRKAGGRVLIRLGDQDVDFSPTFCIFLSTRDPTARFTPDLCSRVTFVNFTVTPSSLQSQCLHSVLKEEQPEIHQKRLNLIKLQGEFTVKLRKLERSLLEALNESRGNILDDDKVMSTLETLKKDAAEVQLQVEETDKVMEDIRRISEIYNQLALASSRIYFTLEQMSQIHFLYQFSLNYFLEVFYSVLQNNKNLTGLTDTTQRLEALTKDLFFSIFRRVSRSLHQEDRLSFAIRLAQIRLKGTKDELNEELLDYLMRGGESTKATLISSLNEIGFELLNEEQKKALIDLLDVPKFGKVKEHIQTHREEWFQFLTSSNAEYHIPQVIERNLNEPTPSEITKAFEGLLLLKAFRMDRFAAGATIFIQRVFGESFLQADFSLLEVVEKESRATAPLLLCSMPGHDASSKVDDIAQKLSRKNYKAIAIGSAEGFHLAEEVINKAPYEDTWVLLKNIHLAPQWLVQLEKKLHSLKPHPNFRLFMTSEIHPKLPANLLRMSHIFVFEPPAGIKANLLHTLHDIPTARMNKEPAERSRLYFLLFWFHAVIQERLRYVPFGWSKTFEFTDTDKRGALDTIDYWIDKIALGRSHIDPDSIPWKAIRTLLAKAIYGGRLDNDFDVRLLESFLDHLFSPHSFDHNFQLVPSLALQKDDKETELIAPDENNKSEFVRWVEKLSDNETPAWLGLPKNAEILRLKNYGKKALTKLLKMQTVEEDSAIELSFVENEETKEQQQQQQQSSMLRPLWIRSLEQNCLKWLELLPQRLEIMTKSSVEQTKNPLFRFFEREVMIGHNLLKKIRNDLQQLILVCRGEIKQTNYLRTLMNNLTKGVIPKVWKQYPVTDAATLNSWFIDFVQRIKQLQHIKERFGSAGDNVTEFSVWLGGLFNPEAFVTASRQRAARAHKWSLENIVLTVQFLNEKVTPDAGVDINCSFIAEGLTLQGASLSESALELSVDMSQPLPPTRFVWKNIELSFSQGIQVSNVILNTPDDKKSTILVPVYLNEARTQLLFTVPVPTREKVVESVWYQRGVAITTSKL